MSAALDFGIVQCSASEKRCRRQCAAAFLPSLVLITFVVNFLLLTEFFACMRKGSETFPGSEGHLGACLFWISFVFANINAAPCSIVYFVKMRTFIFLINKDIW